MKWAINQKDEKIKSLESSKYQTGISMGNSSLSLSKMNSWNTLTQPNSVFNNPILSPRSIADKFFKSKELPRARKFIDQDCQINWFGENLVGVFDIENSWKEKFEKTMNRRDIKWDNWNKHESNGAKRTGAQKDGGNIIKYKQEAYSQDGKIVKLSYNKE